MANDSFSLLDWLRKIGMDKDVDFLRHSAQMLAQALIDLEATHKIGASAYERSADRLTYRNGHRRPRELDTRVGTLSLSIPKLRQGSFFPSLLEPRGKRVSGEPPARI